MRHLLVVVALLAAAGTAVAQESAGLVGGPYTYVDCDIREGDIVRAGVVTARPQDPGIDQWRVRPTTYQKEEMTLRDVSIAAALALAMIAGACDQAPTEPIETAPDAVTAPVATPVTADNTAPQPVASNANVADIAAGADRLDSYARCQYRGEQHSQAWPWLTRRITQIGVRAG